MRPSPLHRPRLRRAIGVVLGATLLVACPEGKDAAADPVVATVGDVPIGVDEFLTAARVRGQAAEFPRSGAGFEALRDRLVQELIVEEVLLSEAKARGLTVSPEEIEAARSAAADAMVGEGGGPGELDRLVSERFGDPATHVHILQRRLLVSKVEASLRRELREGIGVTDEQVAAARDRFAAALVQPARVRCRQIFLESADAAREVVARLTAGESFEALAEERNGTDGDMGWVTQSSMPPLLAAAIEGLPVGRRSEVVRSPLGYHVFLLVGRSPAAPLPEEEARETVVRFLVDETVEVRFRGWVGTRSDDLGVDVEEEALAALRCCRQGLPFVESGSES